MGILALGLLLVVLIAGRDRHLVHGSGVGGSAMWRFAVANAYGANWASVFAIAIGVGGALERISAICIQNLQNSIDHRLGRNAECLLRAADFLHGRQNTSHFRLPDWFATGIYWFEVSR